MSFRHKKYGGLVRYDHKEKIVYIQRRLNPLMAHAKFVEHLRNDYPEYKVVTKEREWVNRRSYTIDHNACYVIQYVQQQWV